MPVFLLNEELVFPNPEDANVDGLLAIGGDLRPDRLLLAYEMGLFPWYSPPDPVLWWCPDPRCVLYCKEVKISKSMRNVINRKQFAITYDEAFVEVMKGCRDTPRNGQDGTWISNEVIESYRYLHRLGVAHSVEAWYEGRLVGGLYGLSIGKMFFGESMFSAMSNASKAAFIHLAQALDTLGFELIDCQIYNDHLGTLGARHIPRSTFLSTLAAALQHDTLRGNWAALGVKDLREHD
jgi:leucyl/phenylalanyl-tRNA--protein transferase